MYIYRVEWWDNGNTIYVSEYFKCPAMAGYRARLLQQDVAGSQPQLSTIVVDVNELALPAA